MPESTYLKICVFILYRKQFILVYIRGYIERGQWHGMGLSVSRNEVTKLHDNQIITIQANNDKNIYLHKTIISIWQPRFYLYLREERITSGVEIRTK